MNLRVERTIDKPYRFVEAALLSGPTGWVPGLRRRDGDETAELDLDVGRSRIARRVVVRTGPATSGPDHCDLPVWWHAAQHQERYPVLFGVLELARLAPRRTRLQLRASYDPPAGAVGELADRVLLHRVAEASVQAFVDRVAGVLERDALSFGLAAGPPHDA